MNRKTLVLPALAGLLAPVLAACGSTDGAGEGGDPIVVGVATQIEATKAAPAPLDPAQAYDVDAWNMLRGTLQTLMRLPRTGTAPVPEAAESCGFRDTQNEQYRCTLRSGLKFSNGHALTAQDVKFSIDRMQTINNTNGPVSLLNGIDKVETPSDTEVVFHLNKPDATFPQKLATPAAAIVDGAVYPKGRLYKRLRRGRLRPVHPQGGAQRATTSPRPSSPRTPTYKGGVKAKNDKVEMRFFADSPATERALRKGDVDLMNRGLSPDQIKGLENARDEHLAAPGDARPGDPLPRLQHQGPGRLQQGRAEGDGADRQPLGAGARRLLLHRRPALLDGPHRPHRPHQLVLHQVREPQRHRPPARRSSRRTSTPR